MREREREEELQKRRSKDESARNLCMECVLYI